LCQGIGSGTTPTSKRVAGTNTFFLIDYHDIPAHKQKEICLTMVVCEVRPDKDNPDRTRITIGGSRICYPGDVGTNTASLELFKLLLNSVLSRKGVRFSTIDLKNFYLDTPMPDPEYVRIKITDIPAKFIEEYKLAGRDRDGWIFFKICRGCYGLPQAGILANDLLRSLLLTEGYYENPPLASGTTNGVPSNSVSLWITLARPPVMLLRPGTSPSCSNCRHGRCRHHINVDCCNLCRGQLLVAEMPIGSIFSSARPSYC